MLNSSRFLPFLSITEEMDLNLNVGPQCCIGNPWGFQPLTWVAEVQRLLPEGLVAFVGGLGSLEGDDECVERCWFPSFRTWIQT